MIEEIFKSEEVEQTAFFQTKFAAYTGKEPYLFVSYSHRDSEKVQLNRITFPDSVNEIGEELVTVYCDEGSVIQEYCRRNGIREERPVEKENI